MATTLYSFQPSLSVVCSAGPRKPHPNRRNPASAHSGNWWTPIFGWSSDPNYIDGGDKIKTGIEVSDNGPGRIKGEKSTFRGCFTEEKAKELRRKTMETSNFHDVMYHSAIASRLASDVSGR